MRETVGARINHLADSYLHLDEVITEVGEERMLFIMYVDLNAWAIFHHTYCHVHYFVHD